MEKLTPLSILIVDDDVEDIEVFKEAALDTKMNLQVDSLTDSSHLMIYLNDQAEELPYVVFLDLNMPKKNGIQCLQELKKHDRFQHLKVIMFSTSISDNGIKGAYELGASLYVQKPNRHSAYVDMLKMVLSMNLNIERPYDRFMLQFESKDSRLTG